MKEKQIKNNPVLSVVVPVYGTEGYLDRCLQSLLGQSFKTLEVIVVNDASPGDADILIKKYLTDSRVKYVVNDTNQGLLRTRVIGAEHAEGRYIAFVDSDDYVSFDFYRTLIDRAEETEADITVGRTVWDEAGERYVYNYHESCFHFDVLEGEDLRQEYFGQGTCCYSWHTVWNKIYKKSLWDKCMPEFRRVKKHLIMTEDIYFSTILFYNAARAAFVNNEAYFYCVNESASTNSDRITIMKFEKNMEDIIHVFKMLTDYLKKRPHWKETELFLKNGRFHYAKMWNNLAVHTFADEEQEKAVSLTRILCAENTENHVEDEYFFESLRTPWSGGLEYIKKEIADFKGEYISFDIFDTLVKRPFYEPQDIYELLDPKFSELGGNGLIFSKLRTEGESLARQYYGNIRGAEDITLDEIYEFLQKHYKIDEAILKEMESYERQLEIRFCMPRLAGRELLRLSREIGKKVILITDMYLERGTITAILDHCKITGYEKMFISCEERCLKYNGRLYSCAINKLGISSEDILHIGDSWKSDIEGSTRAGIKSIFFPKAREIFENRIRDCQVNRCADIGQAVCGGMISYPEVKKNFGFRCMQALAANRYFDNPYRAFHPESDFNADPWFIGFYLLGMHCMGIVKWLDQILQLKNCTEIAFLARDGYVPMKAYEEYRKITGRNIRIKYLQASRKALMPWILKDRVNFYQLPVEYRAHSPKTLLEILEFADKGMDTDRWMRLLEQEELQAEKPFDTLEKYHRFLGLFLEYRYDEQKHERAKCRVCRYYADLSPDGAAFDMGYSGRIQAAICEALGRPEDVLFIHEDYKTSVKMKGYQNFAVHGFYDFAPCITGVMREYLFSDTAGSCVGFEESDTGTVPVFEENRQKYPGRYIVETIQKGAFAFVRIFGELFGDFLKEMDYSAVEVSLPFEGFLRYPGALDMHIFGASYFEDLVWGAREEIRIESLAMQNLKALGWEPGEEQDEESGIKEETLPGRLMLPEEQRIIDMINHKSQFKRALIWLLTDWSYFKEKFLANVNWFKRR